MPTDRELQFLTLVRQNDARLRRICRVYAGGDDEQHDLLQEILLQLWRSLPSFAGASSPDTWLYRVALNTALAHARRNPARRETTLDDEIAAAHAPADAVDADLDVRARQEQLHAAIVRLDPVDKMLMTMYLDERSYRDIADVLGITETHVGVKLHRIKQALARQLTKETV